MTDPFHSSPEADAAAQRLIARIDGLSTRHDAMHGDVRVRWRRFGFGIDAARPPLVLLHGGHGSWMHWLRNIEALSAQRSLWLPDIPGFNNSDAPPEPAPGQHLLDPSLDALIGTLDALLGAGTEIDLGGFSFGGLVAARLAQRRGGIRRLALIGSGGHGSMPEMSVEMINWRAARDRDEERAALVHNLRALMLHDASSIDALAFAIHDLSCHGTRFRSKDVSRAGGLQDALGAMAGPQLMIWGEHDVTADAGPLVARLVGGHANRQGVVVRGAGHWTQYERADEVNALLLDFFG